METKLRLDGNLSSQQKRQLLRRLLSERQARQPVTGPLSHGQRSLWFLYKMDPESAAYNVMCAAYVTPDLDRDALQRAFRQIVERHAILRTTYSGDGGIPRQTVHPSGDFQLECVNSRGWDEQYLNEQMQVAADVAFDLERGPVLRAHLFERADGRHVLLMTAAHIALDFWSFDLLFDELEQLYRQEITGIPVDLDPVAAEYSDFVSWQRQMLDGNEGRRQGEYWLRQFQDLPTHLDLATDRPRPPLQTFRGKSFQFRLSDTLARQLRELSQAAETTLFTTVLAAFQVLLHRYTGHTDIVVGSPAAGRSRAEFEGVFGYFLNSIALRARVSPTATFRELLEDAKETVIEGVENQDYPFPLLVERLSPPRDASRSPLFQVAFGWDKPRRPGFGGLHPADPESADNAALGLTPFALGQQGAAFDLMLMMLNAGDTVSAALQYNSDLFDESTVSRMVDHFTNLLESIVEDPDQPIAGLAMLGEAERWNLVTEWNRTHTEYRADRCLHELFEEQADRVPDSIAVECGGRSLTYRDLEQRANQLAAELACRGVARDVLVGIHVDRSVDMLVAMLAVLKSGGAYVPLEPRTPPERLSWILAETRIRIVLTQSDLAGEFAGQNVQTFCLDTDWPELAARPESRGQRSRRADDLAYVIFTSGSTGKPKGVQIEHRSVVNFLQSMASQPGISGFDVLLAVTTITFDISVLELFLPLTAGATVVIAEADVTRDGTRLLELLEARRATIMQATPATWRLLLEAGWSGNPELKVLCGGETLTCDLASALLPRCASLWNMYGPTETTIWSAIERVTTDDLPPSIGRPIANTQIYILDQQLQPVPAGIRGDLYIGGHGLARGYQNQPQLTSERFIENPVDPEASRRLYRTGDTGRLRKDGKIEFLGRNDLQVKVRGYRIELAEIETALNRHPGIRQSAVMPHPKPGIGSYYSSLIAWLIPHGDVHPTLTEIREYLRESLPDYMLPASLVWMDQFPRGSSGKLDRKSLPEPSTSRPELQTRYVAPRNESERMLVEIWKRVLGLEEIGVDDNFFELGGASIQSLEIAALVKSQMGLEVTPAMLFRFPTISALVDEGLKLKPGAKLPGVVPKPAPVYSDRSETAPTADQPHVKARSAWANRNFHSLIESIGVWFPPRVMSSREVVDGCRKKLWFPLERMTGIRNRHVAGEEDTSFDLAREAVKECFACSRYGVDDIDLLLCCNIVRTGRNFTVQVDPGSAMQLKRHFGFRQAIACDVTNACTGMFTCIMIAEAFLATGQAKRAMIVSGEFITPIMRTAQKEISEFMDARLACLTVGDAGAAAIIEATDDLTRGFHQLDMYSLSKYCEMCIGKLTDQPHGGAIMYVPNPMEHTAVAVKHSVAHAQLTMTQAKWDPGQIDQLIMHQTSDRSLRDGKRAINKSCRKKVCTDANTINNLADRGNTASTTHFVAMWDHILNGRIRSGDHTVFGITGSGQSIGSGLYRFDDLPDRIREAKQSGKRPAKSGRPAGPQPVAAFAGHRVEFQSVATFLPSSAEQAATVPMTVEAAKRCLRGWHGDPDEIELLVFSGLTRTDAICEPAIATMVAGGLQLNDDVEAGAARKTLAFDVYNSSLAFLNACHMATQFLQAGRFDSVMITASEVEQNKLNFPDRRIGVCEAAAASILGLGGNPQTGFGAFQFDYFTEGFDLRHGYGDYVDGKPCYFVHEKPALHDCYLQGIKTSVATLLEREGLDISRIRAVFPPQFSQSFNQNLGKLLGTTNIIDVSRPREDLFSMALPFAMEFAKQERICQPGDIGLIINVGAGVQIGCATYYF
jgi:amino acid adenylation domain-containing protein